jgi:hypothetical protein
MVLLKVLDYLNSNYLSQILKLHKVLFSTTNQANGSVKSIRLFKFKLFITNPKVTQGTFLKLEMIQTNKQIFV